MGFWDDATGFMSGIGDTLFGNAGISAQKNMLGTDNQHWAYINPSRYQSGWDDLINMLRQRASGKGQSLAQMQSVDASQRALNNEVALSHGRSAGAARDAALGASQIAQGINNNAVQARLAEEQMAQGGLASALNGASQQEFNRLAANQNAYTNAANAVAGRPNNIQQGMALGAQIIGAATGAGGSPAQGSGAKAMIAPMPQQQQQTAPQNPLSNPLDNPYAQAYVAMRQRPQNLDNQLDNPYANMNYGYRS